MEGSWEGFLDIIGLNQDIRQRAELTFSPVMIIDYHIHNPSPVIAPRLGSK